MELNYLALSKKTLRFGAIVFALVLSIASYAFNSEKWIEVSGGTWKPDAAVLNLLESTMKPQIIVTSKHRGRVPDWDTYTFQYQGRGAGTEEQFIYVNAFCDDPKGHSELQNKMVLMLDGGACYFSAKYEPATGRLFDVKVNGVA